MVREEVGRVLVIGLDGATFSLIEPWAKEGKLPTLAGLMAQGIRGNLASTIPYITAPAWTSFMTGVNPGKHGIFDFAVRQGHSYDVKIISGRDIQTPTLWKILSQAGKRVGVLNCPVTYPPEEVDGYLVGGMLTPSIKSQFTYPPSLREELLTRFPGYDLEPALASSDRMRTKREMATGVFPSAETRAEATRFLLERLGNWDFFFTVFIEPDRIQTYLWDDMDPAHPRHDRALAVEFGNKIREHYQHLDRLIAGLIYDLADERTWVFIVSDHGFAGVHRFFFPNVWLWKEGYLALQPRASSILEKTLDLMRGSPLAYPAKRLAKALFPDWGFTTQLRSRTFLERVDWSRTRAFWGGDGGLSINLRGREPEGIVEPSAEYEALREELIAKLSALRDPHSGELVVEKVLRREEIYQGPMVELSPDLRVVWKEYPEQKKTYFAAGELWAEEAFGYTGQTGDHAYYGILIAAGPGIKPGTVIQGASIIDLAPTILWLLGLPVPDYMDGRVLMDCFSDDFTASRPMRRTEAMAEAEGKKPGYTPEEEKELREKLRGLGYLE